MKFFFSCDWGTSTFRLRLVDAVNSNVLSAIKTSYGIGPAFESWKQKNRNEKDRVAFYQTYLLEQVKKITASFNDNFFTAPIILSGMASSTMGMLDLPYQELPFQSNGSDLVIHTIAQGKEHPYKIKIISGARSSVDVIRGEETMLAGCNILKEEKEQLFIFPGTHSKHIIVKNNLVEKITTYMTGELFDLLINKSILSASVKKNEMDQVNSHFFTEGVKKGTASNLLNNIFHVRTNQLFGKATPQENYHYLSGLLIGHELKDITKNKPAAITLVCSEEMKKAYMQALDVTGSGNHLQYKNADDALINGQWKIMQQHP